uniref:Uncharacterized protein n=1 Tax=Arundo donax TaxID=35708 RepID=A0A0A9D752_ARUDO
MNFADTSTRSAKIYGRILLVIHKYSGHCGQAPHLLGGESACYNSGTDTKSDG